MKIKTVGYTYHKCELPDVDWFNTGDILQCEICEKMWILSSDWTMGHIKKYWFSIKSSDSVFEKEKTIHIIPNLDYKEKPKTKKVKR